MTSHCRFCLIETGRLHVKDDILQCVEVRDCNSRLRARAIEGPVGPRRHWLRYNKEEGTFELRCLKCAQWQVLDPYSWNPHHGLQQCRACQNAKHAEKRAKSPARLFCKSGRHRWVPSNIYTPPSGRNRSCRLCKNERDRKTISEERAYLRSLSERAA